VRNSRKVEIAGIASAANGLWMSQIGRNLADPVAGILNGKHYLIHDRDPSVPRPTPNVRLTSYFRCATANKVRTTTLLLGGAFLPLGPRKG
jgi:hypothetical protein